MRVAFFRNAVADEGEPRRTESNQFIRVHGKIPGGHTAERGFRSVVLDEVAVQPVVLAGSEILDALAEVAAQQRGSAFA